MADLNMPEITQEEKMTKDFSEETETRLAEARTLAKVGYNWNDLCRVCSTGSC